MNTKSSYRYVNDSKIFWRVLFQRIREVFSSQSRAKLTPNPISSTETIIDFLKIVKLQQIGIVRAWTFCQLPLLTFLYNPNFRLKVFFGPLFLFSLKRSPVSIEKAKSLFLQESANERKNRLYINIGNVVFHDNHSGIPRVAKKLVEEGMNAEAWDVYPVYADPLSGAYRIAYEYLGENLDDSLITVKKGDVLLNVEINPNEFEFSREVLNQMRSAGLKVFSVLHDLLPYTMPQHFRKRECRNYGRWIRSICQFDGLIAISKATLDEFYSWKEKNHPTINHNFKCEWFHLGADFKKIQYSSFLSDDDKKTFDTISYKNYFLQVSTIEPRKGYGQLLDAFDILWKKDTDVSLVIVGRKGWKVRNLIKRIRSHKEYGKRLFWIRYASDQLLQALFNNCQAAIMASEGEGFGLGIVEASYYKKTVIVRDIPVFQEIAQDNALFFKDANDLAQLIEQLHQQEFKHLFTKSHTIDYKTWQQSFEQLSQKLKLMSHD